MDELYGPVDRLDHLVIRRFVELDVVGGDVSRLAEMVHDLPPVLVSLLQERELVSLSERESSGILGVVGVCCTIHDACCTGLHSMKAQVQYL